MKQQLNYMDIPAPAAEASEATMHEYLVAVRQALLRDKHTLDVTSGMCTKQELALVHLA